MEEVNQIKWKVKVGDKMIRKGRRMTIFKSCIFFNQTDFNI